MITVFTTLKPVVGRSAVIQENALRSWTAMRPRPQVIVLGEGRGVAGLAVACGAEHVPAVACGPRGVPLVRALFEAAAARARHGHVCYLNADMIMPPDLPAVVERLRACSFLGVGRRTDLALDEKLDFGPGWWPRLAGRARKQGRLHGDYGIDYFLMPRDLAPRLRIPAFVVGRPCWDNWLIYRAMVLGARVIDLTRVILAVHQEHNYDHHPGGLAGVHHGEEARENLALAGGRDYLFSIADAESVLTPRGIIPNPARRLRRRLRNFGTLHPLLGAPVRWLRSLLGKRGDSREGAGERSRPA